MLRNSIVGLFGHLPLGAMVQLAVFRPDVVIAENFRAPALQAAFYRLLLHRSRLLLCVTMPLSRQGLRERAILGTADGILADGDAVAQAMAQLRFPGERIFSFSSPCELEIFLACGSARQSPKAHRLVFVGDLSPQSGAVDLLISVMTWAEQNPDRPAEILWIGEGDLAGVLGAQPLPRHVTQRFLGSLDSLAMASVFKECGVFVAPSLTNNQRSPVLEALAAGLPVIGSRLDNRVRHLVREDVNGWLFDPRRPGEMFEALACALGKTPEQLDYMREHARTLACPPKSQGFVKRFRQALAAVLPGYAPEFMPQSMPQPG